MTNEEKEYVESVDKLQPDYNTKLGAASKPNNKEYSQDNNKQYSSPNSDAYFDEKFSYTKDKVFYTKIRIG